MNLLIRICLQQISAVFVILSRALRHLLCLDLLMPKCFLLVSATLKLSVKCFSMNISWCFLQLNCSPVVLLRPFVQDYHSAAFLFLSPLPWASFF